MTLDEYKVAIENGKAPEDAPKEDFVVMNAGKFEIIKNEKKNEKVVKA